MASETLELMLIYGPENWLTIKLVDERVTCFDDNWRYQNSVIAITPFLRTSKIFVFQTSDLIFVYVKDVFEEFGLSTVQEIFGSKNDTEFNIKNCREKLLYGPWDRCMLQMLVNALQDALSLCLDCTKRGGREAEWLNNEVRRENE